MIMQYQLAIYFMEILNRTFHGDWYCENVNEPIESWVFTDGERRQKPVPRDAYEPLTRDNLMFKEQRPWTAIMADRMPAPKTTELDFAGEDMLLALAPDFVDPDFPMPPAENVIHRLRSKQ